MRIYSASNPAKNGLYDFLFIIFMFSFSIKFLNGCKKRIPIQALSSLSQPWLFKVRDADPKTPLYWLVFIALH